jgi:Carboxypeptidase regulatory-like domain
MARIGASVAIGALALVMVIPAGAAQAEEATGTITGHITKESTGQVTVNLWTTGGASAGQVLSDEDGNYTLPAVVPGTYKVQFGFRGRWQWAYQKLGFSAAEVINVSTGGTAIVDETLLLPGAVEVVATDAVSGLPVNNYCAGTFHDPNQCGATNGVMRLDHFEFGPDTVYIKSSDGLHARTQVDNVSVVLGQITRLEVSLTPTAVIATTIVDRQTGQPVPGVCVAVLPLVFHELADDTCQFGPNYSDEQGRIRLGELAPGEYTLLVIPDDQIHGIQWVGRDGGTGSQYSALKIRAAAGVVSTPGNVLLDGVASITGVVRDGVTGEPLPSFYGCASVIPGSTYGLGPACGSYEDGKYLLTNLGPYAWPVNFHHYYDYSYPYAGIWSGGAGDRRNATLVPAGVGTPTEYNGSLVQTGPRLRFDVRYADGQVYNGYFAYFLYNARTGDLVKSDSLYNGWQVPGLADQSLKIRYTIGYPNGLHWHGGTNFATAKAVALTQGGLTTVKIVLS